MWVEIDLIFLWIQTFVVRLEKKSSIDFLLLDLKRKIREGFVFSTKPKTYKLNVVQKQNLFWRWKRKQPFDSYYSGIKCPFWTR